MTTSRAKQDTEQAEKDKTTDTTDTSAAPTVTASGAEATAAPSGVVTFATPAFLSAFKVPMSDGEDIVITPSGTPVPAARAEDVRKAAKRSRIKLREQ